MLAQTVLPFGNPLLRPAYTKPMLPQNFHRNLPRVGPRMGQLTTAREKATFYGAGLINLTLMATTAWVGLTVGQEKKGLLGIAGWVTGVGAILGGLYSLGIMGVETAKSVGQAPETVLTPAAA